MGVLLTLVCEGPANIAVVRSKACHGPDGKAPHVVAGDLSGDLPRAYGALANKGRGVGWKRSATGWTCPACLSIKPGKPGRKT